MGGGGREHGSSLEVPSPTPPRFFPNVPLARGKLPVVSKGGILQAEPETRIGQLKPRPFGANVFLWKKRGTPKRSVQSACAYGQQLNPRIGIWLYGCTLILLAGFPFAPLVALVATGRRVNEWQVSPWGGSFRHSEARWLHLCACLQASTADFDGSYGFSKCLWLQGPGLPADSEDPHVHQGNFHAN